MSIIIYTGPVHSGKTSALQQWCSNRKDVGGILMPDINGKRKFLSIQTKELFDAECNLSEETDQPLISIGSYHFYKTAFGKANDILVNTSPQLNYIIIDEIGKLELQQKGLFEGTAYLLNNYSQNLILVVRDSLIDDVIKTFHLTNYAVITTLTELK
jgi:nucleoside-triphosphatase THEP1